MSVDLIGTLTNPIKTFEILHVVFPVGAMGILLITGLKPVPAVIMGLLIGIHIYLAATVPGVLTCSGHAPGKQVRFIVEPVQE